MGGVSDPSAQWSDSLFKVSANNILNVACLEKIGRGYHIIFEME